MLETKEGPWCLQQTLLFFAWNKAASAPFAAGAAPASVPLIFHAAARQEYCLPLPSWRCSLNFQDLNIYCSFSNFSKFPWVFFFRFVWSPPMGKKTFKAAKSQSTFREGIRYWLLPNLHGLRHYVIVSIFIAATAFSFFPPLMVTSESNIF